MAGKLKNTKKDLYGSDEEELDPETSSRQNNEDDEELPEDDDNPLNPASPYEEDDLSEENLDR